MTERTPHDKTCPTWEEVTPMVGRGSNDMT